MLGALLRAGELECGLCDAGSHSADSHSHDAELAATLTDQLATIACRIDADRDTSRDQVPLQSCQQLLNSIRHDGELAVSRPEGFAYYALHPLDFADLASAASFATPYAHVVGIRSIGTTLSAVVAAKLKAEGISVTRTTVRPEGHPYDRRTAFTSAAARAIRLALSRGALFIVCDEGPGRSGSSLLSVAEALEEEGVSRECIVMLCSHQPDPDELCAPRAAERWRRYRSIAVGMTKRLPQQADRYIGGGEWRRFFIPDAELWPASWPQMERLKLLSRDQQKLFKFEGHGPYGEPVRRCEQLLAASGFGTRYLGHEAGFGMHELAAGHQASIAKPSLSLLRHLAQYCAWRAATLPATAAEVILASSNTWLPTTSNRSLVLLPSFTLMWNARQCAMAGCSTTSGASLATTTGSSSTPPPTETITSFPVRQTSHGTWPESAWNGSSSVTTENFCCPSTGELVATIWQLVCNHMKSRTPLFGWDGREWQPHRSLAATMRSGYYVMPTATAPC